LHKPSATSTYPHRSERAVIQHALSIFGDQVLFEVANTYAGLKPTLK
jgi:hypothetical protein